MLCRLPLSRQLRHSYVNILSETSIASELLSSCFRLIPGLLSAVQNFVHDLSVTIMKIAAIK